VSATWPMNLTVDERREALAEVAAENRSGLFSEDSAAWFRSACLEEHDPGYMCLRPKGHAMTDEEHVREFHVMYPTGEGEAADDDRLRRHKQWHESVRQALSTERTP